MKNLFVLSFLMTAFFFTSVNAQTAVKINNPISIENTSEALLKWDQTTFEFGKIEHAVPAKATFTLTNNSDKPLLLKEVKPSCGCTVPAYNQGPIMPGESTVIKATYNAKKAGKFQKTIKVTTNLNDTPIPLKIKGEVIKNKS